ncbi:MAG: aminotransferase class III-fold pyridoxal phosphate-dependent enzyme, partial [Chloroflexota bacterium]
MNLLAASTDPAAIRARDRAYVLHPWEVQSQRDPIFFVKGQGSELWDSDGKRYLDFSAQLANVNLGYQDRRVIDALTAQANQMCFVATLHGHERAGELAEAIAAVTPGDLAKSYFTVGGSEANEIAMQIARLVTGRYKIIARYRGYHGATYGGHSASGTLARASAGPGVYGIIHGLWQDCYRCPFGKTYPGCG